MAFNDQGTPWVTLDELPPGRIFQTREGIAAIKTDEKYAGEGSQWKCVLLASGEYAHFEEKNETEVQQHNLATEKRRIVNAQARLWILPKGGVFQTVNGVIGVKSEYGPWMDPDCYNTLNGELMPKGVRGMPDLPVWFIKLIW